MRWLEENTQWANLAKNYISILKEAIRQDLLESSIILVVWDYCAEWRARIHNLTARDKFDMSDMNPFIRVTGDVADILNICVHKFYDIVQYREQKVGFPFPKSKLGQLLGPCCNNGNEMTMNIMTENGSIVPRCTVIPLTMSEMNTPDAKRQRVIFDNFIRKKYGDLMNLPPQKIEANEKMKATNRSFIPYKDDEVEPNDAIDMNISLVDVFVNSEVQLSQGEKSKGYGGRSLVQAKVIRHFCDEDGNVMGNATIDQN